MSAWGFGRVAGSAGEAWHVATALQVSRAVSSLHQAGKLCLLVLTHVDVPAGHWVTCSVLGCVL